MDEAPSTKAKSRSWFIDLKHTFNLNVLLLFNLGKKAMQKQKRYNV